MRIAATMTAALVFATGADAVAAADAAAEKFLIEGDYDAAASAALAAGGADNLALAARALNAVAYFDAGEKSARRSAKGALEHAEAALKIEPRHADAHLQAAISLSLRGNRMAPVRAFMLNIPARARKHLDAALVAAPDHAIAHSTSAAWRLEVARRGGGAAYGAVPEEGFAEFEKARALAPNDPVIAYEQALRLLLSARAEWRGAALAALGAALALPARSAFEARVKERAATLQTAIDAGPAAEASALDALT